VNTCAIRNPEGEGPHNYNNQRRLLRKYVHQLGLRHFSSIVRLTKGVEMKSTMLSLIIFNHFARVYHEDHYNHLSTFYE